MITYAWQNQRALPVKASAGIEQGGLDCIRNFQRDE